MKNSTRQTGSTGASFWIVMIYVSWAIVGLAVLGAASWLIYVTQLKPHQAHRIVNIPANPGASPSAIPAPPRYECPLDGTQLNSESQAMAARRPIVVQIDNAPGAQPQAGLSQADIVYEAMAEGEITRFSAIYLCHDADVIGPVRSARLIDLDLAPEYSALLADSGSSEGVTDELDAQPDIPNINLTAYPSAYWRTDDRIVPHNLMTSTARLRQAAKAAGIPIDFTIPSLLFKDDDPAPSVRTIGIYYSPWVDIEYRYDPARNGWLRFLNGDAHTDAATGEQLAVKNVIIQYVEVSESDIVEDVSGAHGLTFKLTGRGRAQIFQDGKKVDCFWRRDGRDSLTYYVDSAGELIPLDRGLTFVQVVPLDFQVKIR